MRTDYLKYDASSLQELLTRKLTESGLYTDQVYPGSDTRILIDLFSWTFDVLTYILNNTASNSLFDDTEVYENINKIVKLLSYKPRAYTTSNAEFSIHCTFDPNISTLCSIPKFAYIESDGVDSDGNGIRYSFIEDYSFKITNGILQIINHNPILYNGIWTRYTFENSAQGIPYEKFIMNNISSNVDNDTLHVYVEKVDENGKKIYTEVIIVNSLILDASPHDLMCEARLNEHKEFVFKFGDNIHGKKIAKGSKVHVIYLKSNGGSGKIDSNQLNSTSIKLGIAGISSSDELLNMCYGGVDSFILKYSPLFVGNSSPIYSVNTISMVNMTNSSEVKDYESIDEIRENTPSNFRLGNRLVTLDDYKTFIKSNFSSRISDIFVCNNFEYCSLFYKWLDMYNSLTLNIRMLNYHWANACDFNNVYIWLKPIESRNLLESDKNIIIKKCDKIKTCTTNIVPCEAIKTYFMPFLYPLGENTYNINDYEINSSYLPPANILIKKGSTYLSDEKIKTNVVDIIITYFKSKNKLGESINLSDLYQQIMTLGYIESVKTMWNDGNSTLKINNIRYIEGLSFAKFTPSLINNADFEVFTQYVALEKFQYPELLNSDSIKSLIKITDENIFSIKNNEF